MLPDRTRRDKFSAQMKAEGIDTPFHYVPLHSSPAGLRYGRAAGDLPNTDFAGEGLVRLPLYPALSKQHAMGVARGAIKILEGM